jgi:hypothetical protein
MSLDRLKLRLSTLTEPILPGQGFYQLEEDTLYVQIGSFSKQRRFFSYLEAENVRLDLDREGRLIFVEVSVPRRLWKIDSSIKLPTVVEAADIRWLDFRERVSDPILLTDPERQSLVLRFNNETLLKNYFLAEKVIAQVNDRHELSSIWIIEIIDDLAGQQIGAFRKKVRDGDPYQPSVS